MQTMSTNNKSRNFFVFIFILLLQIQSSTGAQTPIILRLEKMQTICISREKNIKSVKCDIVVGAKLIDSNLGKFFRQSDEILSLFSQPTKSGYYLVVVARTPSKFPQSTGYCGSGYEDHLLLIEYANKKLLLRDDFILQSCLKSIALDSDGGSDIMKAISVDKEKYTVAFRWLINPDDKKHTLSILNGKFQLADY